MAEFKPCFEKVMRLEGGPVLHKVPGDTGGATYAGIARNKHPKWLGWVKIDRNEFDAELNVMVRDFFKTKYWDRISGDKINSQDIAYQLYAFSVNAGRGAAVKIAQRILHTTPDGGLGPITLKALNNSIEDKKDEKIFVLTYSLLKIDRYKNIAWHDKRRKRDKVVSNLKFLCGWINRTMEGL